MIDETKGLFVVLEGGEGAGKTTQLGLLEQWLAQSGRRVVRTREPGGTEVGERIRALVLDHGQGEVDPRTEALLFAASRAAHVSQKIRPALDAGAVVLCDRYIDSSLAYQGAGRGLGVAEVAQINAWATEGLEPNLTVLLDVDPLVSARRRASRDGGAAGDRIESADLAFHTTLREAFLDRAAAAPGRYLVLNGEDSVESLHRAVRTRLESLLSPAGSSA
ncbi:dTMP kinase [Nesterenkonia haasae]|uniref:dTMP kinase n=1 Tax=Nesterenkonia haasae TaxID=2587813 RepID=UPI0013910506|nr:dTMP kinase [Nesterenkonia haasae]NDK31104.1 dTMP kinase [Nesterenkonia haasae]